MEDAALLQQIAHSDATAFQQFYTRYAPRMGRYLWRRLDGDQARVEEALQEVFLAAWRSAGDYRGEAPVGVWLFRIARYWVAHARRDASRRPEGHLISHDAETAGCSFESDSPQDDSSAWVVASHEHDVVERLALRDGLSRLSPKHREALELVFLAGFTLEEAARILDIPLGTIKSRVSYARKALMRELAEAQTPEEVTHDA